MRRYLFLLIMPLFYIIGLPYLAVVMIIGRFNRDLRLKLAYGYNRLTSILMLWISGAKFVTTGLENLNPDQTVLYVGNHRSMLDIPLLMKYVKRPIIFIGKESVLKFPVVSWWMIAGYSLFIDREKPRQGLKVILKGIELLKSGDNMAIFPEGTRSKTPEIGPFKQGSLKLSTKSGAPIVPFALKGTDDVFENNGFNLKAKTIYFHVGEIIPAEVLQGYEMDNGTAYVRGIINEMYEGLQPGEKENK